MKSKKVFIPLTLLVVLALVVSVFWARRKAREREVLVSAEVIHDKKQAKEITAEGLVSGELREEGRNFQLRLVAEVHADPRTVYHTLVDFDHLKDLIPDCTKLEVVESAANRTVVYMKRFVLFMGKEMGGKLEYTLHPEQLKFEVKVLRDPNANLHETWFIEPSGGTARVTYVADVEPKLKVPIFMAQAWIKDNFVDLMKAVKDKLEGQSVSG
jgi:ribosome-associated toxin RatA of RatAB toxin-antitoxin module